MKIKTLTPEQKEYLLKLLMTHIEVDKNGDFILLTGDLKPSDDELIYDAWFMYHGLNVYDENEEL